jgi:FMN phosphatase YigB (HAD superfamily)
MKVVVFDLDGTLADTGHRLHLLKYKPKKYDEFYELCGRDELNEDIASLFRLFSSNIGWKVIICTGRRSSTFEATHKWLTRHKLRYDELHLRKDGDFRPDEIIKSEMLDKLIEKGDKPDLVVDDRDKVVKMWRDRGIRCLQACDGNY